MRRITSALAALALLALAVVLAAPTSASAMPVRATTEFCPATGAYPISPDATVQVSSTAPRIGEKIEVSGIVYCPNEAVAITLAGKAVGTGHTNGTGVFDPKILVSGPAGPQQVCGIGASGLSLDRDCLTIDVQGSGSTTPPGTSSGGGPAMTGVEIALLGFVALALIVGGVVFTTLGRSRRAARA